MCNKCCNLFYCTIPCSVLVVFDSIQLIKLLKHKAQFTAPTRTRHHCLVFSAVWKELATSQDCRQQKISKLSSLKMQCEQFCPSYQSATRTCLQTSSNRRQDWTKLFSLSNILRTNENRLGQWTILFTPPTWTKQHSLLLSLVWTSHKMPTAHLGMSLTNALSTTANRGARKV